jgi:electron transfer flavoprotein alpha subunit
MMDDTVALVVAETEGRALADVTLELLGVGGRLAAELEGSLATLLIGADVETLASELSPFGVRRALVADDPTLAEYVGDRFVPLVVSAVRRLAPAIVLFGQTSVGRELAPRVAFRLGAGVVTDCTGLRLESGQVVATKPIFGGNAVAEYAVKTRPAVVTLRPRSAPTAPPGRREPLTIERLPLDDHPARTRVVETVRRQETAGPRLKDAKIVVVGGRGLGAPEHWQYVEALAEALDGAVGATRAVTDRGWVPPSLQVGLTGATIAPDLYIAVGVSGAVQHMAGVAGAKTIVAINKDPEANIFRYARYGVIGDWRQVLPSFTRKVRQLRGKVERG